MDTVVRLSTLEVNQLLFGIPELHQHCRLLIKTDQDQVLVFSEALVAAIARSYISVKTHPERKAIEMNQHLLKQPKDDFASFQLLETERDDLDIQKELATYFD